MARFPHAVLIGGLLTASPGFAVASGIELRPLGVHATGTFAEGGAEIGRASCRERVSKQV